MEDIVIAMHTSGRVRKTHSGAKYTSKQHCESKEIHIIGWAPASVMPNYIKNAYSLSPHGNLSGESTRIDDDKTI